MAKKKQSKSQRHMEVGHKREERSAKRALKHERQSKRENYLEEDDVEFISFANQLQAIGLKIKDVPGDGNCLFRALADQLDGDMARHGQHRQETVQYMIEHRPDFEPFVEDDVPFHRHVNNLAKDGTFGGNDSIVAFSRNHNVDVLIHQHNAPLLHINGNDGSSPGDVRVLNVSYHHGEHYASVRRITEPAAAAHPGHQTLSKGSAAAGGINGNGKSRRKPRHTAGANQLKEAHKPAADDSSRQSIMEQLVPQLIELTGCEDIVLLEGALEQFNYDIELATECVLMLHSQSPGTDKSELASEAAAPPSSTSACPSAGKDQVKPAAVTGAPATCTTPVTPVTLATTAAAAAALLEVSKIASRSAVTTTVASVTSPMVSSECYTGTPGRHSTPSPALAVPAPVLPSSSPISGKSDRQGLPALDETDMAPPSGSRKQAASGRVSMEEDASCPHGSDAACGCRVSSNGSSPSSPNPPPIYQNGKGATGVSSGSGANTKKPLFMDDVEAALLAIQIEELSRPLNQPSAASASSTGTAAAEPISCLQTDSIVTGASGVDLSGLGLSCAGKPPPSSETGCPPSVKKQHGTASSGTVPSSAVRVKVGKHTAGKARKADKKKERKQRRAEERKQEAASGKLNASAASAQLAGGQPGYVASLADRPDGVPKIVSI
ncbi:uncharacterized protein LOC135804746 [Sycon ciliatum]|uniref:uncharacterized protein LOC135804746 n=1 Tax=Sycon ciliatum TaxID=27933 RepID=UPI0031F5F830